MNHLKVELLRFLNWSGLSREEYLLGYLPHVSEPLASEWEEHHYPYWSELDSAFNDAIRRKPTISQDLLTDLTLALCVDWLSTSYFQRIQTSDWTELYEMLLPRFMIEASLKGKEMLLLLIRPIDKWSIPSISAFAITEVSSDLSVAALDALLRVDAKAAIDVAHRLVYHPRPIVRQRSAVLTSAT